MMSSIHRLEETTSRLLNASQYIIETASLVKELIDNSLDAGATCIEIEASWNAVDFIRVKDNGHGVAPTDVDMLARASCTSKISHYEDLSSLGGRFLGFRGMALSCIARMSGTMEIYTRTKEESAGLLLQYSQKGEILSRVLKGGNPGTTVIIKNFLASLEVRRKAIKNEYAKHLAKIKLVVQGYSLARPSVRFYFSIRDRGQSSCWEHEGRTSTTVDAVRNVFGLRLVSDCMLRYWSSATGFAEKESDLYTAKGPHFAISAVLFKPNINFRKENDRGQYCSVDSRPITSTRGTMKKMANIYRSYLHKAVDGEVKNPFLCVDIMCPAGSYDPNVEPAKDDVLFTAEESVLAILERFFQAVYGEAIQQREAGQLTAGNLVSIDRGKESSKPTNKISEIPDSTSASSSFLKLTQVNEQAGQKESPLTKSILDPTASALSDEFVDISSSVDATSGHSRPDGGRSGDHHLCDRGDNTRTRNSVQTASSTLQKVAGDVYTSTSDGFRYTKRAVGLQSSALRGSEAVSTSSSVNPATEHIQSKPSLFQRGSYLPHHKSMRGHISVTTSSAGSVQSTRKLRNEGPMDRYLKPIPGPSNPYTATANSCSLTGTRLADIPVHTARKRKATDNTQLEACGLEQTTAFRDHVPDDNSPALRAQFQDTPRAAKARVSFMPNFSLSPQNSSTRHDNPAARPLARSGLITPDASPLKRSLHTSSVHQEKPSAYTPTAQAVPSHATPQNPPIPQSTKKPFASIRNHSLKSVVLRISPSLFEVERSFHVLKKYDGYAAADEKKSLPGFDVSGLSQQDTMDMALRCGRAVQALLRKA